MRAVRKADTKPEVAVRSELYRLGYRFRKEHKVRAAGRKRSIDIAFPGDGLAVFIDGCFWHQCPEHGTVPKTNRGYWVPKLKRNVARDELVTASLRRSGWTVLRIWEHTPPGDAAALIAETLEELRLRRRRSKEDRSRTAADLFAGAGGSTQGLKQAGYEALAAVEFDAACAKSYRKNHKGAELIERDITEVTPAELLESIGLESGELVLLNACPPCQGFSSLGATDEDDHRNDLVSTVFEFISAIRPRAFILENVPGLARDRRMKALLSESRAAGYSVKTYRLNATDFGVAQNRRRLIAIGVRGMDADELPEHPAELLPVSFRREHERITKVLAEAGPFKGTRDRIHRGRTPTPEVAERIKLIPKNGGRFDLPEGHQLDCHKSWALRGAPPLLTAACALTSQPRPLRPAAPRPRAGGFCIRFEIEA